MLPAAFAVVKRLHISNSSALHFHLPLDVLKQSIFPVTVSAYTDVIPVADIKKKCLYMYLDVSSDCKYVARFPCTLVHDYLILNMYITRVRKWSFSRMIAKMRDDSHASANVAECNSPRTITKFSVLWRFYLLFRQVRSSSQNHTKARYFCLTGSTRFLT